MGLIGGLGVGEISNPSTSAAGTLAAAKSILPDPRDGVTQGFAATVYPSPQMNADPYFLNPTFTGAQAAWTQGPALNSEIVLSRVTPNAGSPNPGTQFALQVVATTEDWQLFVNSARTAISADLAAAIGPGDFTSYVDVWLWTDATMSPSATINLYFIGWDVNGNQVGTTDVLQPYAFGLNVTPGAWVRTTGTCAPRGGSVSGAKYLSAAIWADQISGTHTYQFAGFNVSLPFLGASPTGLFVSVGPGIMSYQGLALTFSGAVVAINASSAQDRYDLIAYNVFSNQIVYSAGTPGAGIPPTPGVFDMPLWQVYVPANAVVLTVADLTDLRVFAGLSYDSQSNATLRARTVLLSTTGPTPATATGAPAFASLAAAYANATTGDLSTGTGASFTALTADAKVSGTIRVANNTLADGVVSKVWLSTVAIPAQGVAPGGTDTEEWQATDTQEGLAGNPHTQAFDLVLSGLTVGTTYYVYLSIAAVTGGTATASGGHNETTIQVTSV